MNKPLSQQTLAVFASIVLTTTAWASTAGRAEVPHRSGGVGADEFAELDQVIMVENAQSITATASSAGNPSNAVANAGGSRRDQKACST